MAIIIPLPNANQPSHPSCFPSAAQLVNGSNNDLCVAILGVIKARGLHLPPNKPSAVASSLWLLNGTGVFDGRFLPWADDCVCCNMRERIDAIF